MSNPPCGHVGATCIIGNFWQCKECEAQPATASVSKLADAMWEVSKETREECSFWLEPCQQKWYEKLGQPIVEFNGNTCWLQLPDDWGGGKLFITKQDGFGSYSAMPIVSMQWTVVKK